MADDGWDERAACRDMGPHTFFSEDNPSAVSRARAICDRCDVAIECLEDALSWPASVDYGIRGGLTPDERADLRVKVTRRALEPTAAAGRPESVQARPPHGTPKGYQWERRRKIGPCPACRDAEALYRDGLVDDMPLPVHDPRHGTPRGYRLGCRDERCPTTPSCADAEKARYEHWYARQQVRNARNNRRRRGDWGPDVSIGDRRPQAADTEADGPAEKVGEQPQPVGQLHEPAVHHDLTAAGAGEQAGPSGQTERHPQRSLLGFDLGDDLGGQPAA